MPAPILLFTYKRLDTLKRTVTALQANWLASESELFVFSDAPKYPQDESDILKVREFISNIDGFRVVHIIQSRTNKGLANSIIEGVTQVIEKYGKVIVLEDDLVTSQNFLVYMNQALDFYQSNSAVLSISGYSNILKYPNGEDVYFTQRASSWGWATWIDRWAGVDWKVKDYESFSKTKKLRKGFNRMGSDMSRMLDRQIRGEINSWAIRWCYHQYKYSLLTVYPFASKVENIGFDNNATHTKQHFNRFKTILDISQKLEFDFVEPELKSQYIKAFVSYYSLSTRIKYKILNILAVIFIK